MVPVHRELWLLGTSTTTVWADIGDPDFPFAPIPGAFLEQGIGAIFGWTIVDNALVWLGQNEDGARVVLSRQWLHAAADLDARRRAGVGQVADGG